MKFKKILLILLSFFLILSLVSCTQKESEIQNEDKMEKESEDMKDITIEKNRIPAGYGMAKECLFS